MTLWDHQMTIQSGKIKQCPFSQNALNILAITHIYSGP